MPSTPLSTAWAYLANVIVGSGGRGGGRRVRGVAGLGKVDEDDCVAEDEDEARADEEGGEASDEVAEKVGGGAEVDERPTEEEEGGKHLHAPEEALHLLETVVAPHGLHGGVHSHIEQSRLIASLSD